MAQLNFPNGVLFAFDIAGATSILANSIYFFLALAALWGGFCVVVVWMRVAQKRFRNEEEQVEFLQHLYPFLQKGDFEGVSAALDGDTRAIPQLALMAVQHRNIGYAKVRQLLADRFQRDVLTDLDHRLTWVSTVIKTAPMLGLLGTVMGMMGAFGKLAGSKNVSPDALAGDIMVALITTACGLAIAIPLVCAMASINVRIRKMEDLVSVGLTQFLEVFRGAVSRE